jgi:hypothetical protein
MRFEFCLSCKLPPTRARYLSPDGSHVVNDSEAVRIKLAAFDRSIKERWAQLGRA